MTANNRHEKSIFMNQEFPDNTLSPYMLAKINAVGNVNDINSPITTGDTLTNFREHSETCDCSSNNMDNISFKEKDGKDNTRLSDNNADVFTHSKQTLLDYDELHNMFSDTEILENGDDYDHSSFNDSNVSLTKVIDTLSSDKNNIYSAYNTKVHNTHYNYCDNSNSDINNHIVLNNDTAAEIHYVKELPYHSTSTTDCAGSHATIETNQYPSQTITTTVMPGIYSPSFYSSPIIYTTFQNQTKHAIDSNHIGLPNNKSYYEKYQFRDNSKNIFIDNDDTTTTTTTTTTEAKNKQADTVTANINSSNFVTGNFSRSSSVIGKRRKKNTKNLKLQDLDNKHTNKNEDLFPDQIKQKRKKTGAVSKNKKIEKKKSRIEDIFLTPMSATMLNSEKLDNLSQSQLMPAVSEDSKEHNVSYQEPKYVHDSANHNGSYHQYLADVHNKHNNSLTEELINQNMTLEIANCQLDSNKVYLDHDEDTTSPAYFKEQQSEGCFPLKMGVFTVKERNVQHKKNNFLNGQNAAQAKIVKETVIENTPSHLELKNCMESNHYREITKDHCPGSKNIACGISKQQNLYIDANDNVIKKKHFECDTNGDGQSMDNFLANTLLLDRTVPDLGTATSTTMPEMTCDSLPTPSDKSTVSYTDPHPINYTDNNNAATAEHKNKSNELESLCSADNNAKFADSNKTICNNEVMDKFYRIFIAKEIPTSPKKSNPLAVEDNKVENHKHIISGATIKREKKPNRNNDDHGMTDKEGSIEPSLVEQFLNDEDLMRELNKRPKRGFYKCIHCSETFNNILDYAHHLDENNILRPFKCPFPLCPWKILGLPKRSELRRHCAIQHMVQMPLKLKEMLNLNDSNFPLLHCKYNFCDKLFYRKDSYARHVKMVHKNVNSRFNRRIQKIERGCPYNEEDKVYEYVLDTLQKQEEKKKSKKILSTNKT